jgi:hypothetical protein
MTIRGIAHTSKCAVREVRNMVSNLNPKAKSTSTSIPELQAFTLEELLLT